MHIKRRIEKLALRYPPDRNCPKCGYPATAAELRVVITDNTDPLPKCPTCGHSLDEDGVPLPPIYKRIIMPRKDGEEPAFP